MKGPMAWDGQERRRGYWKGGGVMAMGVVVGERAGPQPERRPPGGGGGPGAGELRRGEASGEGGPAGGLSRARWRCAGGPGT